MLWVALLEYCLFLTVDFSSLSWGFALVRRHGTCLLRKTRIRWLWRIRSQATLTIEHVFCIVTWPYVLLVHCCNLPTGE